MQTSNVHLAEGPPSPGSAGRRMPRIARWRGNNNSGSLATPAHRHIGLSLRGGPGSASLSVECVDDVDDVLLGQRFVGPDRRERLGMVDERLVHFAAVNLFYRPIGQGRTISLEDHRMICQHFSSPTECRFPRLTFILWRKYRTVPVFSVISITVSKIL